jgi:hypothetical protein
MSLSKLNSLNALNYIDELVGIAIRADIPGNNSYGGISLISTSREDFIKLSKQTEVPINEIREWFMIRGRSEQKTTEGVKELGAKEMVTTDKPIYVEPVGGSASAVANSIAIYAIVIEAYKENADMVSKAKKAETYLSNLIMESLDENITNKLKTKYGSLRFIQIWEVMKMINEEYIRMNSTRFEHLKGIIGSKLCDIKELEKFIFEHTQAIKTLKDNDHIMPATTIAENFLRQIQDVPALKNVIEEYRRLNPNQLLHKIEDIIKYIEEQKDNISRKNISISEMLNENITTNFTKRIEQLEKDLIQANNAKIKNNNSTKQKQEKDKKQAKYCYHCGYGSHLGTECYHMNADTHAETLINAISPKVKGEIDGNSKVHFRFQK